MRGTVLRYLRHQVRPQVHHQLLRFAGTEATKIAILAAMRVVTKQFTTTVPLPRTPALSVVIAMALLVVLNIVLV